MKERERRRQTQVNESKEIEREREETPGDTYMEQLATHKSIKYMLEYIHTCVRA